MVADGKKLLVLDINGLLIDTYFQSEQLPDRPHDAKINRFYVYKRTGCEEFVQYCLDNFVVGVWSSAREHNVMSLVEYTFKEAKDKLAFIWHQTHCTDTKLKHPENKYKPVFLKELSKLWDKTEPDLPWERGDFGPSNTVLIDDSPYKALKNPPHTGIFPATYKATCSEDNYLAGELCNYLKGLVASANVQVYLQKHPIGMPSLDHGDEHYLFFSSVKDRTEIPASPGQPPASPKQEEKVVAVANSVSLTKPDSDVCASPQRKRSRTKFGSTVEESLEYRVGEHGGSPRDFAERLSRVVDTSQNATCERDPLSFDGTNGPNIDGTLGRPPSHGDSRKFDPRESSHDRDRARGRLPPNRDGQFYVQSQRSNYADSRQAPPSGRRTSVIPADGQWSKGGFDSHKIYNHCTDGGNQWFNRGPDPQQQNRGQLGVMDSVMLNRWGGHGEWQSRERELDHQNIQVKYRGPVDNRPSTGRPWHSPVPHVDYSSRTRVPGAGMSHLEDKRGWSRDSRCSYRGGSPYTGRLRERELLPKDKSILKGRLRGGEHVYRDISRDPEFPHTPGSRPFDNAYNVGSREHEITHRIGARDHEDFDRSYSRAPLSHYDGYTRGRKRQVEDWNSIPEKNPHGHDSNRVRGRSRHHEGMERSFRTPLQVHDSRVEGSSNDASFGDYGNYRHMNKVPEAYDERSEENNARSKSRNWRDMDKGHCGPSGSYGRRGDDIGGRNVRSSSRNHDHAHSRGRHWNTWRNDQ
ncbi:hypothetical protein MPTK1_6g03480 [Marchantia polymorpha subsp. ruderalis]|nr:hypothetical protein MARPO_0035s0128 [Marchantia polymorpha]BBN13438.1 hypothetical protein Mp_6g03480 [Marchantia polymorpha subsp. ruderalis]|eukprot:PTQ41359.1 hypothetical protein MARPO_0035s0128 [Marchantia polymorpha]